MKILLFAFVFLGISYISLSSKTSEIAVNQSVIAETLPNTAPDKDKSLKAFQTILTVLKSPRCINCHPTNDVPRQGDVQRLHPFGVVRGAADEGGKVQKCSTCHHGENADFANVPGAPHWALAPKSMGWFGQSDAEIGRRLMAKKANKGRSPQDLVKHMSSDSLVLWAWNPGKGRQKPPVELDEWRKVLQEWLVNGAAVPTE
jgi:hypothetical protein